MAIASPPDDGSTLRPQINVTPLVDVVLVLLIIFMVVSPLLTRTFWVHTPAQERRTVEVAPSPGEEPLVVRADAEGRVRVNGKEVPLGELDSRLRELFAARGESVLFFDADDELPYGSAVRILDVARSGGAVTIGVLTTPLAPAG
jgi:biopolymer transport protein ExbD